MPKLNIKLEKRKQIQQVQKKLIYVIYKPQLWDAPTLIKISQKSNLLKGVSTNLVINHQSVTLTDISLKGKGFEEDHIFASDQDILDNIRRGLTVVHNENLMKIARKGLKKFFDVQMDDLKASANVDSTLQSILRLYSLYEIEQSLNYGKQLSIFKLEKVNGENAQISYLPELDSWVICSKNVSLLAHSVQDLTLTQYTQNDRFQFALLIGQSWFNTLNQLNIEQIVELKKILSKSTFVGEYCGNQNFQHLVYYDTVKIIFYAIVPSDYTDSCINPLEAISIFKNFGLSTVNYQEIKTNDTLEFYKIMRDMFVTVASKSVEEEGEGDVVYFVCENRVLSLCKLKTLEYRLFRKLREKLKNTLTLKKDSKTIMKNYEKECQQLQEFAKAHKPQEYYNEIAQKSIIFAESFAKIHPSQVTKMKNFISSRYIDFLNEVKKKDTINVDDFNQILANYQNIDQDSENEENQQQKLIQEESKQQS